MKENSKIIKKKAKFEFKKEAKKSLDFFHSGPGFLNSDERKYKEMINSTFLKKRNFKEIRIALKDALLYLVSLKLTPKDVKTINNL